MNTRTAPTQPTETVTCAVSADFRARGDRVTGPPARGGRAGSALRTTTGAGRDRARRPPPTARPAAAPGARRPRGPRSPSGAGGARALHRGTWLLLLATATRALYETCCLQGRHGVHAAA